MFSPAVSVLTLRGQLAALGWSPRSHCTNIDHRQEHESSKNTEYISELRLLHCTPHRVGRWCTNLRRWWQSIQDVILLHCWCLHLSCLWPRSTICVIGYFCCLSPLHLHNFKQIKCPWWELLPFPCSIVDFQQLGTGGSFQFPPSEQENHIYIYPVIFFSTRGSNVICYLWRDHGT